MNTKFHTTNHGRAHARRGNTLILVAGTLVLLVIIATAYFSRAQSERVTASVHPTVELRDDRVEIIAMELANELAMALFARPVDPDTAPASGFGVAESNDIRLAIPRNAGRFNIDQDANNDDVPDFDYNYAPYHVIR